jgi:hypothetical protein
MKYDMRAIRKALAVIGLTAIPWGMAGPTGRQAFVIVRNKKREIAAIKNRARALRKVLTRLERQTNVSAWAESILQRQMRKSAGQVVSARGFPFRMLDRE